MDDRKDPDLLHTDPTAPSGSPSLDALIAECGSDASSAPGGAAGSGPKPVLSFRPVKEPKPEPKPKEPKKPGGPKAPKEPKKTKSSAGPKSGRQPSVRAVSGPGPKPAPKPKPVPKPKPKRTFPTPQEAYRASLKQRRSGRVCCILAWIFLLFSGVFTVLGAHPEWTLSAMLPAPLFTLVPLGLLVVHIVLSMNLLVQGVTDLTGGRFTGKTLLALTVFLTLIRGFVAAGTGGEALCAAASLLLTVSLWSDHLLVVAKTRIYARLLSADRLTGVVRVPLLWDGADCLCRADADLSHLVEDLESEPAPKRTLDRISLLLLALAVAAAAALSLRADRNFFWMCNIMLLGAFPLGGMGAFGRAMSLLSRRTVADGAAVPGWDAAERLCGEVCFPITDEDLFSPRHTVLNGTRTFGSFSVDRVLAYAAAILEHSGAGVTLPIREELEHQNGRHYRPGSFRVYDAGGLGGEVQGDIVLLGSMAFMQTMGIPLPKDALLPQALYLSVNGEAAGVFAIEYIVSEQTRPALASLLNARSLRPLLASRDVLLTPDMVQAKYHVPADRLEYPSGKDRRALASPAEPDLPGALLLGPGFAHTVSAVLGARRLCDAARAAVRISLAGAVLGLILTALMSLFGSVGAVSALTLLIFHVLWLIPALLCTAFIGK